MHGDFSRDSFTPKANFTQVLLQQGSMLVDADWNEQSALIFNYIRNLAADLIGWHGGTNVAPGFKHQFSGGASDNTGPFIVNLKAANEVEILPGSGRYYLDGIQIDVPSNRTIIQDNKKDNFVNQLIYLEVWEQLVVTETSSALGDSAFEGHDRPTRLQAMVRIHLLHTSLEEGAAEFTDGNKFRKIEIDKTTSSIISDRMLDEPNLPQLAAYTQSESTSAKDCDSEENSGYTGLENQLYRVEVHQAGGFWNGVKGSESSALTIKWSRDNGSVIYSAKLTDRSATLSRNAKDPQHSLGSKDWVEVIKIDEVTGVFAQVERVEEVDGNTIVRFASPDQPSTGGTANAMPPLPSGEVLLRRWDHRKRKDFPLWQGGILVKGSGTNEPSVEFPLEDGIIIQLSLPLNSKFHPGDYWMIPARAAKGIIWDKRPSEKELAFKPASYIKRHFAPIALNKNGTLFDLRNKIKQATTV